jgi:hypothetical protein
MKTSYLLLFFLVITLGSKAQWVQTNGPIDQYINCLEFNGTKVLAGTSNGVYLTSDYGFNWTARNEGLATGNVFVLHVKGSFIFAGFNGAGIYRSSNEGSSWTKVNNGLGSLAIYAIESQDSYLFAATESGIFVSSDNGTNWIKANIDVPDYVHFVSLAASDSGVYAGSDAGSVYASTDHGLHWIKKGNTHTMEQITSLAASNSGVFACRANGVIYSAYSDSTWTLVVNNLESSHIISVAAADSLIVATASTTDNGVYFSFNNGLTWQNLNEGFFINGFIMSVAVNTKYIYLGIEAMSVWRRSISEIMATEEYHLENAIRVYPNPASDLLTVDVSERNLMFTISAIEGRIVLSGILNPDHTIDVSKLGKGIYVLQIWNEKGINTTKILIQ